jgi:hypothetical protein
MAERALQVNGAEIPREDATTRYRKTVHRELGAIRCELAGDKQTLASSTKAIVCGRATLARCTALLRSLGELDEW